MPVVPEGMRHRKRQALLFPLSDWAHMRNLNHALSLETDRMAVKLLTGKSDLIFHVREDSVIQHNEQNERILQRFNNANRQII